MNDVSLVSRSGSRFKSFKLIVPNNCRSLLLDNHFWPKGFIIKPWRNFSVSHSSKEYFNSEYRSKDSKILY